MHEALFQFAVDPEARQIEAGHNRTAAVHPDRMGLAVIPFKPGLIESVPLRLKSGDGKMLAEGAFVRFF